jgi:hypothetical protein
VSTGPEHFRKSLILQRYSHLFDSGQAPTYAALPLALLYFAPAPPSKITMAAR